MRTPAFWQSKGLLSNLLLPASLLYGIGAWADRRFTTPQRAPRPVISIGNVTAGGAGKTPTTIAIAAMLRSMGQTPHILTRGYGGTTSGPHRVQPTDTWQDVGDEALLLASAAPTWVGHDRLASAHAAAADDASILLCDDALQHHALHKDLSLLVIDGPFGFGNGRLLPAGPLREPLAAARARCHGIICIGPDAQGITAGMGLPIMHATLAPPTDTAFLASGNWLAFAGIGRPEKFFTTLRAHGAQLAATRSFPDHHAYTDADAAALLAQAQALGARLITTQKDTVKLSPTFAPHVSTLPVTLQIADMEPLMTLIRGLNAPVPASGA